MRGRRWAPDPRLRRAAILGSLALLATLAWLHVTAPTAPPFERVRAAFHPSYARLLDREGRAIHELRTDPMRRRLAWTPLDEVSPALVAAVTRAEDRWFVSHGGVDYGALAAAAWQRLSGGPSRGASTISMQVAGMLDSRLAPGGGARGLWRTPAQKWRQMRLTWALERSWGKPSILEAYLNLATFRGELQGVGAASAVLLGAAPHGVTPAEGAVLAVLLRAPGAAPGVVARRARHLTVALGLDAGAAEPAVARALHAPPGAAPGPALAPHVAHRLLGSARAGAAVSSTLDGGLQEAAAEILRRQLLVLHGRHVRDGAVLVADNATGAVLAYVGGSAALGLVGGDELLVVLRRLGLSGLGEDGEFYGPALALGGADASLWELVGAYRALAAGGTWSPLRLRAEGAGAPAPGPRVYSPAAAYLVADILADRESRSLTFGLDSALATRFWAAVKTGTSRDMRDNWCVGFSRRYTVGVWVGNFAGAPMRDVSGVSGAAPVWREVMEWLHRRVPSPPPAGLLAGPGDGRAEWFLAGTEPAAGGLTRTSAAPPIGARIVAPVSHAVIALDPDVPSRLQRMAFEAEGAVDALRWRLGDRDLGRAGTLVLWPPRPGTHVLALVDAEGGVADRVVFHVRGAAVARDDGAGD